MALRAKGIHLLELERQRACSAEQQQCASTTDVSDASLRSSWQLSSVRQGTATQTRAGPLVPRQAAPARAACESHAALSTRPAAPTLRLVFACSVTRRLASFIIRILSARLSYKSASNALHPPRSRRRCMRRHRCVVAPFLASRLRGCRSLAPLRPAHIVLGHFVALASTADKVTKVPRSLHVRRDVAEDLEAAQAIASGLAASAGQAVANGGECSGECEAWVGAMGVSSHVGSSLRSPVLVPLLSSRPSVTDLQRGSHGQECVTASTLEASAQCVCNGSAIAQMGTCGNCLGGENTEGAACASCCNCFLSPEYFS